MIKCLPTEVQGRLRSGVAVPSLQQCVEELVLNGIDAGSTCVGVRLDMVAFKVQVIDNGSGMSAEDMECVGSRYHTSKCSSLQDLEDLRFHGFRGEALASVVSLASLVEISSRSRSSVKTHVKLFKEGKGMSVFEAESTRPSAGTTVIVCNFFHNMPVRRKRVDTVLEAERIRHRLEAIALMHPDVSFTLKNDCTGAMTVQLPKARSTYHRFVQIYGLSKAHRLREISHTHKQFHVTGHLGVGGHYNNSLQFLYVNERLLLKTPIHKLLNTILLQLSSPSSKHDKAEESALVRSPKVKHSTETYGIYIINIKCSYAEYDICLEPAKTLIEFKDWDGILLCIKEAVKAFLSTENLVAEPLQEDMDGFSTMAFSSEQSEREKSVQDVQANIDDPALDCTVATKLASESVHRQCRDDSNFKSSNCVECSPDESSKKIENTEALNNQKYRDEPHCHLVSPEVASYPDNGEDETMTVSDPGEFEVSHESPEIHGVVLPEREFNCAASSSGLALTHSPVRRAHFINCEQPLSKCTTIETHERLCAKKISLSKPYILESLQILNHHQSKKPNDNLIASKRKISLAEVRSELSPTLYGAVVPCKAPRTLSKQKLSMYNHSGSLDKFRRMFGKPASLKLPFKKTQTEKFELQCDNIHSDVQEAQSCSRSPPTTAIPSTTSSQSKANASLSAKLFNLKQQTEVSLSAHTSQTISQGIVSSSHDEDDAINNGDKDEICNVVLNPHPVPDVVTNSQQEDPAVRDWMDFYDTAAGKTVHVNRVTGLSRYEGQEMENTEVQCTSDITNMAVSVISETGDTRDDANSLSALYSKWKNPVFVHPPMVGIDVSSGQAEGLVVKIHNVLFPYRFSKAMIHSMKVINQVDKKFLACLIDTCKEEHSAHTENAGNLLVLVDQHAAHERVRLESLVADSYEDDLQVTGERCLCSSSILPPLQIDVTEEEMRLLRSCQSHLRSLGLEVIFSQDADLHVMVAKVPLCFAEKEHNELCRGRPSVIRTIVKEYVREQTELLRSTGRVRGTLPLTVLKVLASLACHGAVKFNSALSKDECHSLISSLSSCQLPFQCAHGRPSIAPLVDLFHLDRDQELQTPNLKKLKKMYNAWQLFGNR